MCIDSGRLERHTYHRQDSQIEWERGWRQTKSRRQKVESSTPSVARLSNDETVKHGESSNQASNTSGGPSKGAVPPITRGFTIEPPANGAQVSKSSTNNNVVGKAKDAVERPAANSNGAAMPHEVYTVENANFVTTTDHTSPLTHSAAERKAPINPSMPSSIRLFTIETNDLFDSDNDESPLKPSPMKSLEAQTNSLETEVNDLREHIKSLTAELSQAKASIDGKQNVVGGLKKALVFLASGWNAEGKSLETVYNGLKTYKADEDIKSARRALRSADDALQRRFIETAKTLDESRPSHSAVE